MDLPGEGILQLGGHPEKALLGFNQPSFLQQWDPEKALNQIIIPMQKYVWEYHHLANLGQDCVGLYNEHI